MNLTGIMQACARANRLAASDRERAGIERAAASILDAFGLPQGADRAHFMAIAKGAVQ